MRYPKYLLFKPKSLSEKIFYRLSLLFLKTVTANNYYDRAVLWGAQIKKTATEIIRKEKITNVIASGAPFHLIYHVLKVKQNIPGLNLIADFRDMWTSLPFYMGISSLSASRLKKELAMETDITDHADVIISVSDEILNGYRKKCHNPQTKFAEIPNGFDKDDIPAVNPTAIGSPVPSDNKIHFVFTGTLYLQIEYIFVPFLKALEAIRNENIKNYNLMQFSFYGDFPDKYKELVRKMNIEIIKSSGHISLDEVYGKISASSLGMLFLIPEVNYSFSTKFCEYLSMRKKIIVFSKPGKTSDFIIRNNLGYAASAENIKETLLQVITDFKENRLELKSDFDVDQYSIEHLTGKLIECFR